MKLLKRHRRIRMHLCQTPSEFLELLFIIIAVCIRVSTGSKLDTQWRIRFICYGILFVVVVSNGPHI